jgi:1-acyl-sn-glycerol-3-phosphate acyltransferase
MFKSFAYLVCRIFFREVHVSGSPFVGTSTIWAANHSSAIVDPAVMTAFCPVKLRPLAKHTLFSHPVMLPLLKITKAIPVHRTQDMKIELEAEKAQLEAGAAPKEWRGNANTDAFKLVSDSLIQGDNVLIFPEGVSHDEPYLHKLKTGVARMALQALTHTKDPKFTVVIQPVAIDYTEKDEFRSDLAIHFCDPIAVTSNETLVDDIMLGLRNSLSEGFAQFRNWDEKRNWQFVFEMAYGRKPHSPREFRVFVDEQRNTFEDDPVFFARVQTMRRMLMAMSVEPFQLIWGENKEKKRSFYKILFKYVWFHLLISVPLKTLSALLWYFPYRLCGHLAHKSTTDRDLVATMKIAHGAWVFPTWSILLSIPLFFFIRVSASQLVDSTGNLIAYGAVVLFGPLLLILATWVTERRDFFPGYWKLAKLRLLFPRAWVEVKQEWVEISQGVIEKIQTKRKGATLWPPSRALSQN